MSLLGLSFFGGSGGGGGGSGFGRQAPATSVTVTSKEAARVNHRAVLLILLIISFMIFPDCFVAYLSHSTWQASVVQQRRGPDVQILY